MTALIVALAVLQTSYTTAPFSLGAFLSLPDRAKASEKQGRDGASITKVSSFNRPEQLSLSPKINPDSASADASKLGLYVGSMVDSMPGNGWETSWVRQVLASEFNMMVPGTQLKWASVEPTRGTFDFRAGDELVEFAVSHHLKVRGHNLVWGMFNPPWLGNAGAAKFTKFTGAELEEILVTHIRTVMRHYRLKYPGIVKWWDVTNEIMGWNDKFNSDRILWSKIGSNPDGADFVRLAFRTARAEDPSAVLCMNDWGNEGSRPDRTKNMISAVRSLRDEGVPIDCVGMEAHVTLESAPNYQRLTEVMEAYARMGVQVQITEFDIRAPRSSPDWGRASEIMNEFLRACVNSSNCTAFNMWGISQEFLPNNPKAHDVAMLPWNTERQRSPVYLAMRAALSGRR